MIRLKSLQLKSRIIQSPMAGCTDLAFRLLAREHGMEFAFLEMVSAETLVRKNPKTLTLMKSVEKDRPLGAQIVGCDPGKMGEAASIVEGMGFDLVDINMGCPVPKVVSPGGGSALLAEPDKARAIFRKVVEGVKRIPATVKMRIGFNDPSGDEALHIARCAEEEGLSAISIHGRTRAQGYTGKADWQVIGRIKSAVGIPVFGNGDITNSQEAVDALNLSGCDGVMIGRGGLGNPWIYREIDAALSGASAGPAPTFEAKRMALLKHLELELQTEDPNIASLKMRKIACWYFRNIPGNAEFRNAVNRSQGADEIRNLILNFRQGNPTPD